MKWKLRLGRRAATAAPGEGDAPPGDSEQAGDCEQPAASEQFESEVFEAERRYLENRWQSVGSSDREIDDAAPGAAPTTANNLVGLALSGGGIRSATFNLGLLQSLHRHGVFRHVDYLSTVSGGGFLGSSVSTLMGQKARRKEPEPRAEFPMPDSDQEAEVPEVTYLRNNSNYLAANGLLDYLRLAGVLIRGILLNFLVLVPLILVGSMVVILAYGQLLLDRIQEDDDVQRLTTLLDRHWSGMEDLEDASVASLTRSLEDWSMFAVHRDKGTADAVRWLRGTDVDVSPLIIGGPGDDPAAYRFRSDATGERIVDSLWESGALQSLDVLEEIAAVARVVEELPDTASLGELLNALGVARVVEELPDRASPSEILEALKDSFRGEPGAAPEAAAVAPTTGAELLRSDRGVEGALDALRDAGLVVGGENRVPVAGNAAQAPAIVNAGSWKVSFTTPAGDVVDLPLARSAAAPAPPREGARGRSSEERLAKGVSRRRALHELYVRALYDPRKLDEIVQHRWNTPLAYWQFVELAEVRKEVERKGGECPRIPFCRACYSTCLKQRLHENAGFLHEDSDHSAKVAEELDEAIPISVTASAAARNLYYGGLLNPDWIRDRCESEELKHDLLEYERQFQQSEERRATELGDGTAGAAAGPWSPYRVRLPSTVLAAKAGLLWIALFPLLLWFRRFLSRPFGQSCLLLVVAVPVLVPIAVAGFVLLGAGSVAAGIVAAGLALVAVVYWLVSRWFSRRSRFLLLVGAPLLVIAAGMAQWWLEVEDGPVDLSKGYRYASVAAGLALIGIVYWLLRRLRRVKSALWWRDLYERSFSWVLIAIGGVAVVELQPYLIYRYSHLQLDAQWITALGGASLLSVLSAGPLLSALKSVGKIVAMVAIVLLGPILPLLIYIEVVIRSLYWDELWSTAYSLNSVSVLLSFGLGALLVHFINLPLDVNSTSMHSFYRDRLSRAYLIARRKDGEMVPEDDLSLREICLEGSGAPYHLINAALNLQGTSDPAMRRRHSDFFTFSRDFIGGARTGYCKTKDMERVFPHLHLSSAMAVSAAAAAPNMGTFTFGPLVVLMALLNIRLGFWLPNPSRVNVWARTGTSRLLSTARSIGFAVLAFFGSFRARPGAYALIKEMLSLMHDRSRFVNLSDGGHIENTGAYELLRRRCRFIVIGDAEADSEMSFPALATLVRYARIDLGIEIEIHVDDLRLQADGESRQHCAIGVVHYPDKGGQKQDPGLLLYVKSSLTGDEDQVVAEYRMRSGGFPHESTADQAFNEGQFEAYRALGFHIGEGLFDQQVRIDSFEAFRLWFEGLRVTLSPGLAGHLSLVEIDAELGAISDLLRQPELESYFYELYPDLKPRDRKLAPTTGTGESFRQVFHVVDRQLRLMQTLFRSLELGQRGNLAHPSNRGWINLFRRWAQSPTFKRIYLRTISTCSGPFQQFCESSLGLRIQFRWRSMRKKQILLAMSEPPDGEEAKVPAHKVGQLVAEMDGVREKLLIGHAKLRPGGGVSVGLRDGYQGTGMLAKAELALHHWALEHRVSLELEMPSEVLPESGEALPLEIVAPDAEPEAGEG